MSKLNLLILDANVVIYLHMAGLWPMFVSKCDVHLPETVLAEAAFFDDENGQRQFIDLSEDIQTGRISTFSVSLSDLRKFRNRFKPLYTEELDPGELEALTYLCESSKPFLVSSGDAIVYKVLGLLNRGEQGLSLEEIFLRTGLQQLHLPWQQTKQFREQWTKQGFQDLIQGRGLDLS